MGGAAVICLCRSFNGHQTLKHNHAYVPCDPLTTNPKDALTSTHVIGCSCPVNIANGEGLPSVKINDFAINKFT